MDMIERVAAAMAEVTNGGKWDDGHYCDDHKALWMKRARAAITAMREPTEAMRMEAQQAFIKGNGRIVEMWSAMIDAALSDRAAA